MGERMQTVHRPRFWRTFLAKHWNQTPAFFRDVLPGSLGTERALFDAIVRRVGDRPEYAKMPPIKLYRGGSPQALDLPNREAATFSPRADDGTLRAYLTRLQQVANERLLGFIVNDVQALQPEIYERASMFLDSALSVLPFPSGGTLCASFFGTYKKTQVGIHKDPQNVFVIPISGRKRFYLWSEESLRNHPAVVAMGDRARATKARIDNLSFEDVEHLATYSHDVAAGDLLYIPKGTWHIALPQHRFNASFHVGLFNNEPPPPRLQTFFQGSDGAPFRDIAVADRPKTDDSRARDLHQWRSAHGFLLVPPPHQPTESARARLACVAPNTSFLLESAEGSLDVIASGRSLRCSEASPRTRRLLRRILSGRAFTRSDLRSACAGNAHEAGRILQIVGRLESVGAIARA